MWLGHSQVIVQHRFICVVKKVVVAVDGPMRSCLGLLQEGRGGCVVTELRCCKRARQVLYRVDDDVLTKIINFFPQI